MSSSHNHRSVICNSCSIHTRQHCLRQTVYANSVIILPEHCACLYCSFSYVRVSLYVRVFVIMRAKLPKNGMILQNEISHAHYATTLAKTHPVIRRIQIIDSVWIFISVIFQWSHKHTRRPEIFCNRLKCNGFTTRVNCIGDILKQEAFEKCWAHSPQRAVARRITIHQASLLSHRTPSAHRCPRRRRRRQRVTEGTAMAPWNGPNQSACNHHICLRTSLKRLYQFVQFFWQTSKHQGCFYFWIYTSILTLSTFMTESDWLVHDTM